MKNSVKIMLAAGAIAIVGGAATAAGNSNRESRGAHMFDRFDANSDGVVTRAEVDASFADRFVAADANEDGQVNLDELTTMVTAKGRDRAERMMKHADANADGVLTIDEMGKRGRRGDMFERLDADGDGVITKAEAEEMRHGRRHGKRTE